MELAFNVAKKQLVTLNEELIRVIKRRFTMVLIVMVILFSSLTGLVSLSLYQQSVDKQRIQLAIEQERINRQIYGWIQDMLNTTDREKRQVLLNQIKQAGMHLKQHEYQIVQTHTLIAGLTPQQRAVYFDRPYKLDQRIKNFTQTIDGLSRIPVELIHHETAQLVVLNQESLGHMENALIKAIDVHIHARNQFFLWTSALISIFMMMGLPLLIRMMVSPSYRSLKKEFNQVLNYTEHLNQDCQLEEELSKHFKREMMRQRAAINSIEHMIIVTDHLGMIKLFNRHAESILGYLEVDLLGKCSIDYLHDREDLAMRAQRLSDEFDKPISPGLETLIAKTIHREWDDYSWLVHHKNGTLLRIVFNYRALWSQEGDLMGFLGIGSPEPSS